MKSNLAGLVHDRHHCSREGSSKATYQEIHVLVRVEGGSVDGVEWGELRWAVRHGRVRRVEARQQISHPLRLVVQRNVVSGHSFFPEVIQWIRIWIRFAEGGNWILAMKFSRRRTNPMTPTRIYKVYMPDAGTEERFSSRRRFEKFRRSLSSLVSFHRNLIFSHICIHIYICMGLFLLFQLLFFLAVITGKKKGGWSTEHGDQKRAILILQRLD